VTALEINKLRDILTLAGPSDLIEVETLVVDQFSSVSIKTGDIRRILRCQPPNEVKTPKIFHKSSACIEAEKFSRALMAANFVGDLFDLSLDSKEMRVSVTHEKGEDVNVHFESGELRWLNASYPITTTYGLDYVVGLVRTIARRLGQDIHVHVEPRYPLKLAWFHSVNHREEPISWEYWQAPRIPKE
jgi:hypothetical protein